MFCRVGRSVLGGGESASYCLIIFTLSTIYLMETGDVRRLQTSFYILHLKIYISGSTQFEIVREGKCSENTFLSFFFGTDSDPSFGSKFHIRPWIGILINTENLLK